MESRSKPDFQDAVSVISGGTVSASSDEISLAFSSWDEISDDVLTEYYVLSEICGKYKIPIIVITPPEGGPYYSEGVVFPIESYITCCSELTLSSEASEDTPESSQDFTLDIASIYYTKPVMGKVRNKKTCGMDEYHLIHESNEANSCSQILPPDMDLCFTRRTCKTTELGLQI